MPYPFIDSRRRSLVHRLILGARCIFARIDPDVDDRRTAQLAHRFARPLQGRRNLRRIPHLFPVSAQHFGELAEGNIAKQVADAAALLAVLCELAIANLIHRRVVADDREIRDAETIGGLHIESCHAERSVAVVAQNFLGGVREARGNGEARADAQRTQRTRIHPLAGAARADRLCGNRDDVAAISDINRVLGQKLVELPSDAVRMNRHAVRFEQRHQLFGGGALRAAQLLEPRLPSLPLVALDAAGSSLQYRSEDCAGIADQSQTDIAVLTDGAVVHVDLHQLQVLADALAVAHAEVERRPDDHDDVGACESLRACSVEVMRISGRQQTAAGAIEIAGYVQPAQQRDGLDVAARRPDLLSVEDRRPLGVDENIGQLFDVARIAERARRRAIMAGLGNHSLGDIDLTIEHVSGDFQVSGTRGAVERLPGSHRDHVRYSLGRGHRRRELGDRRHQIHMRQILQRPHLVLRQGALPADVQNRTLGTERGRDAGDRVRAARAGGGDDAAQLAGLTGIAVGRVRGHLLMPHIDDANTFIDAAVIDIDDVAAAQREDGVDAFVFEGFGDQVAAGYHARVAALTLQRILGRCARFGRIDCCHAASNFVSLMAGRQDPCRPARGSSSNPEDQVVRVVWVPATLSDAAGYASRLWAKCLARMGFNTNSASRPAITLNVIAVEKTAPQPWVFAMVAATGTRSAPAPLAVYSMPALDAANFEPKVSPWVAGKRLKISPYTPKYSAVTNTKTTGFDPDWLKVNSAHAPAKKASAIV